MWTRNQSGQTIVEILIAAVIVAVSLTVMVSITTASIAHNREAKERTIATRLAQESLEWIRGERDRLGWDNFYTIFTPANPESYCLNSSPIHANIVVATTSNCAGVYGLVESKTKYKRVMTITYNNSDPLNIFVQVDSVVSWQVGDRPDDTVALSSQLKERD